MIKKAYEKPEIKKVALKPEEAVLQACKTTSGGTNAHVWGWFCSWGRWSCSGYGS